jgi:hypothetical protein
MNFLHAKCPTGKRIVHINLDETSVCYWSPSTKGNVLKQRLHYPHGQAPVVRVSTTRSRATLTHVAMISDDEEIQKLLPQVLVANRRLLTREQQTRIQAILPMSVFLKVQQKGWNNVALMCEILKLIAACLKPVLETVQVVLSLDAARIHLHPNVFRQAYRLDLWMIVVPACTTWLLQPLDTHVFRRYKATLREVFNAELEMPASGASDSEVIVRVVCRVITHVVSGMSWNHAFARNGFTPQQEHVSKHVLSLAAFDGLPCMPATQPTEEDLICVFPGRCYIPYSEIFRGVLSPRPVLAEPLREHTPSAPRSSLVLSEPDDSERADGMPYWYGRTRSTSSLPLPPPAAPLGPPPRRPRSGEPGTSWRSSPAAPELATASPLPSFHSREPSSSAAAPPRLDRSRSRRRLL